jgi:hypothetical protein
MVDAEERSRLAIVTQCGQLSRLMVGDQRINHLIDLAHHHPVELVECQVYPVVGHPALGEIVGSDPFRPVTRADLTAARLGPLVVGSLPLHVVEPRAKTCMARARF